jgi:hypothetical protein
MRDKMSDYKQHEAQTNQDKAIKNKFIAYIPFLLGFIVLAIYIAWTFTAPSFYSDGDWWKIVIVVHMICLFAPISIVGVALALWKRTSIFLIMYIILSLLTALPILYFLTILIFTNLKEPKQVEKVVSVEKKLETIKDPEETFVQSYNAATELANIKLSMLTFEQILKAAVAQGLPKDGEVLIGPEVFSGFVELPSMYEYLGYDDIFDTGKFSYKGSYYLVDCKNKHCYLRIIPQYPKKGESYDINIAVDKNKIFRSCNVDANLELFVKFCNDMVKEGENTVRVAISGENLILAIGRGDIEGVKDLLERGLDPNSIGYGDIPLIIAIERKQKEIIKLLLSYKVNPNIADNYGNPALILACYKSINDADIVEILLKAGADPNIKNKKGEAPLSIAADNGNWDIVNLLRNAGVVIPLDIIEKEKQAAEYRKRAEKIRQRYEIQQNSQKSKNMKPIPEKY